MPRFQSLIFLFCLFLADLVAAAPAAGAVGVQPTKRAADFPWMSIAAWDRLHAEDVLAAQFDEVDVLFLGDSIVAGWDWQIWQRELVPLKAANFAIGGDHTGNVLWRLQHGAIGNLRPRVVVVMIGVNNFGHLQETPAQVAAGVEAVVRQVQLAWPASKILLNGVLPFEQAANSPRRQDVRKLNQAVSRLADKKRIVFKDYGPLFLAADGSIPPDMMADFLHPTAAGYAVWTAALVSDIQQLLQPQN